MRRKAQTLARLLLIGAALVLEAGVIQALITRPPADLMAVVATPMGFLGLIAHLCGAALLAFGCGGFLPGGSMSDRASVVVLYFVLALVLPGAGAAGVALITFLLARGGIDPSPAGEFVVGNAMLEDVEHGHDAPPEVHLEPLLVSTRSFDTESLGKMLLALRGRAGHPGAGAILRRYQQDSDSEVQFYAQSAVSGATETAEADFIAFEKSIAENPDDASARAALADRLLSHAERAVTPKGDRKKLSDQALGHLEAALRVRPLSLRLQELTARAHLAAGDATSAQAALEAVVRPAFGRGAVTATVLDSLYRGGEWDRLIELSKEAAPVDARLKAAMKFWSGAPRKGVAA